MGLLDLLFGEKKEHFDNQADAVAHLNEKIAEDSATGKKDYAHEVSWSSRSEDGTRRTYGSASIYVRRSS